MIQTTGDNYSPFFGEAEMKTLTQHLRDKVFVVNGNISLDNAKEAVEAWLTERRLAKGLMQLQAETKEAKRFLLDQQDMIDDLLEELKQK